ncbi:MAG: hypothetical protein Q8R82_01630 [Hyphomonadaceae bacterium]|nr:hypothetical protein [Hyphomonadaceae bacterium]
MTPAAALLLLTLTACASNPPVQRIPDNPSDREAARIAFERLVKESNYGR